MSSGKQPNRRGRGDSGRGGRGKPASAGGGRGRQSGQESRSGSGGAASHRGAGNVRRQGQSPEESRGKPPSGGEGLPRHVVDGLLRVTPATRANAALKALSEATEAFTEGRFHVAVRKARHAKELASRDATIREILGLASYRIGDWAEALRELRTFRRLSGETTHVPVEMDVLRALKRPADVESLWEEFRRRGGRPAVEKEARVVYASHLIDTGDFEAAAAVVGRPRPLNNPFTEDLRLWYVAARVAALGGDAAEARRIAAAIVLHDPAFPGLDELDRIIARA